MDDAPFPLEDGADPVARLSLVVRIGLVLLTLALAGVCVYECATIVYTEVQLLDMRDGKPLPLVTQSVVRYRAGFVMLALFLPCFALTTFFQRDQWLAVSALIVLVLISALHAFVVYVALCMPFIEDFRQLGFGG